MPEFVPSNTSNSPLEPGLSSATVPSPESPHTPRPTVRRRLAGIVLGCELIIVFLAALVVWGLARDTDTGGIPAWWNLVAGGILIALITVTLGMLRYRWAFIAGWSVQALIVTAGVLNPAMYVVGALFGGLWWYCMVAGARIDHSVIEVATSDLDREFPV